ncbi:MAG: protein kinase domain-containing protein [Planctomycetota bacterium]
MYEIKDLINNQYEVRMRLAGGMGYVYIVFDQVSQKTFAIKTLRDELLEDDIAAVRFEREARTWINLGTHGNIVHAVSFQRGKQPLLILEYIDGLSLERIVSSEPAGLSLVQVIAFAIQMAEGLAFAHECLMPGGNVGVVHRDLKPGNVMVARNGVAKLTDFGLARAQDDCKLTLSGNAMGTFPYMPPEQWKDAHAVTSKADIYSLGVVLYEMVAGMRPFPAATPTEIMFQTLYITPEPVCTYRPDVDPGLAGLIMRCLMKAPEDRPESARALVQELRAIQRRLAREWGFPAPCPTCGYIANRKLLRCVVCGTVIGKQPFQQTMRPQRCCRCGWEISAEYCFCTRCGERQQRDKECGKCGTTNPAEYRFCCKCGSKLVDD